MKAGRSLVELATEIERQRESAHDYKAPSPQVALVPVVENESASSLKLNLSGIGQFDVNPLAHDQIGQHTGIPSKYYDRMLTEAPELLAGNVNHWLSANPTTRLVRTLDNRVRAFLSNRYRTIDNWMVAEAILPVLVGQGDIRVESCEITEKRLYIKAVSPKLEGVIQKAREDYGQGHSKPPEEIRVQSGIVVSNSEVGLHGFQIDPLVFILACLNGAIIPKSGMRRYHIGRNGGNAEEAFEVFADDTRQADDRALMLKMRDSVKAAFDSVQFNQLTKALSVTTGRKIQRGPEALSETIQEVFNVRNGEKDGILKSLMQGGDYTQWGLSNAFTAFAQDKSLDYERATELEKQGGEILMLPVEEWDRLSKAA